MLHQTWISVWCVFNLKGQNGEHCAKLVAGVLTILCSTFALSQIACAYLLLFILTPNNALFSTLIPLRKSCPFREQDRVGTQVRWQNSQPQFRGGVVF